MKLLAGIFFATMAYVALRSWQQLNVVRRRYWWIVPTSMLMAMGDVFLITAFARSGWVWSVILSAGVGGGLGSLAATVLHHRWLRG